MTDKAFQSGAFPASTPVAVPLKRQLLFAGIPLAALELLLAAWPLWTLLRFDELPRSDTATVIIPIYIVFLLLWVYMYNRWLRPLARLVQERSLRGSSKESTVLAASRAMSRIPVWMIVARTSLWGGGCLAAGLLFLSLGTYETWYQVHDLVALGIMHGYIIACLRGVVTAALIRKVRARLFPDEDINVRLVEGYQYRFRLVGMAVAGGYIAGYATFVFYFVPISGYQYIKFCAFLTFALTVALWVRIQATKRVTRRLDNFLQAENRKDVKRDITPVEAHQLAQSIPYRLAFLHAGIFIAIVLLLTWYIRLQIGIVFDTSVVILAVGLTLVLGAFIYESLAHRQKTATVIGYLTAKYRFPVKGIRSSLSLGTKLLIAVGGVVLFACLLAVVWGVGQYRNLSSRFVAKQVELRMEVTMLAISNEISKTSAPLDDELVLRVLEQLEARQDGSIYFYLSADRSQPLWRLGQTEPAPEDLPWYVKARIIAHFSGSVNVPAAGLTGAFQQVPADSRTGRSPGAIAIFFPDYAASPESVARPVRELFVFFIILFGACAGIAVLVVMQFSAPVRQLEQQANLMAQGVLTEPVRSGAEGDEIGRLTFALEEMRMALLEKLQTSEEQAAALELAVDERTADLAAKNKELAEALASLTAARSQLARSEKLASIGQLVAGIAHEINNPVNAVVNTIEPLRETIDEMAEGKEVEVSRADAEEMLQVMARGAERTKAIVRALHNYSRTDDQHVVAFELDRALNDTLELLRHSFKGVVKVERDYGDVGRITAHAGQINQVFMNLLTNAIQAVAKQDDGTIKVQTRSIDDEQVMVKVIDNGPGIEPKVLEKIFDPFFTTKDVGEGTGLGLSIVHSLIERHGGSIGVDSTIGEGTVFTVVLPRQSP